MHKVLFRGNISLSMKPMISSAKERGRSAASPFLARSLATPATVMLSLNRPLAKLNTQFLERGIFTASVGCYR